MNRYVARKPRHAASGIEVEVGDPPASVKAELVNLSRDGFQLRLPLPLNKSDPITMRLCEPASGLCLTLSGVVRWRCAEQSGTWLLGCQSDRRVDLETMGEMFLSGVLVADAAAMGSDRE